MPKTIAAAATAVANWYAGLSAVAQIAVQVAVSVAASAATSALTRGAAGFHQGSLIELDLATDAPRRLQSGKRGNGGVMVDVFSAGNINEDMWQIIYLGEGPMGNLIDVYANGYKMALGGPITHGQTVGLSDYFYDNGFRIEVTYYDGRPGQTANSALVAKGVGYKSTSVGRGNAYVIVKYRYHDQHMTAPPSMFFVTEGAKFYDRRKDSTAGGLGTHRLRDPATWELTANPAVCLDHYLLGRYLGAADDKPIMGIGLAPADVPFDRFAAAANLADEDVGLAAGGTQKRYEAHGFVFSSTSHDENILQYCKAMNARPADFGGRVSIIDGEAKTAVMNIDDDDVIEATVETYEPKRSWSDVVGRVQGTYQDPENNFQPTEYPRIENPAWVAEDGGEVKVATYNLEMEIDSERAQRLATLYAQRERRQATLSGVYSITTILLEEGDWFVRTGAKWGTGKLFEVIGSPKIDPVSKTIQITAFEVDPTDSAWDNAGVVPVSLPPAPPYQTLDLPIPNVTLASIVYELGTTKIPAVRFTNADFDGALPTGVEIQIALNTGTPAEPVAASDRLTHVMGERVETSIASGILPNANYMARWRGVLPGRTSSWSAWVTFVSTPDFQVGEATLIAGRTPQEIVDAIDTNAESIALEFLDYAQFRQDTEARLFLNGETLGTVITRVDEKADDLVSTLALLGAANGDQTAFILEGSTVQIGTGAQATTLTTMRTQVDTNKADIVEVKESVDGAYARAALTLDVNDYITGYEITNDGTAETSSFIIIASNFAIIDPGNGLSVATSPFSVQSGVVYMSNVVVDTLAADSVTTNNLVDNSVNEFVFSSAGSVAMSTSYQYITTDSIVHDKFSAGTVLIFQVSCRFQKTSGSSTYGAYIKLSRDGVLVEEYADIMPESYGKPITHTFVVFNAPAGQSTWTIDCKAERGQGGGIGVTGVSVTSTKTIIQEAKK